MGRGAECVYSDQASICALERVADRLLANSQGVLVMRDGCRCDGVVSAQPSVQIFHDDSELEGLNVRVTLLRPDVPEWSRQVA